MRSRRKWENPGDRLVNEIISNSLKHAFPSGRSGRVWLELTTRGEEVTMVLGDDGVGMPESAAAASTGTLGVQLISSLVSQIGGSLQLERGQGTVYTIRFERKK
ncbi:sensor histidine kinase [Methanocella sp. MCL-LM]|uniref:sensor histidine kinase n=1 Tax=Methanocella sp. MCL-LM TaxID=3412035 RepID=UPI003C790A83